MVTALACNYMRYDSILRQKVLVGAYSRSSCILVARNERTKESESRGPHLNSLEEFFLPVYFLETDNIVVLDEPPEIVEFQLRKTDPVRPLVF